jgi:tetratricopeptide (TPR) repeat protein
LPKFYNRRKVAIKQIVSELELSGLDSNASRNLLSLPFLNEKEFSKIYSVTNGHPLSLELIRNHIMSKTMKKEKKEIESSMNIDEIFRERHDINLYFREEILQNLIISEKKLLEIVSVFHYPVPPELFFIEEGIDYNTIDKLDSRSIIQETSNGYDTHELIKEFFYRRLTPKLKKKYHLNAAKYYMSELMTYKSPQDKYISCIANPIIEAQYHYIRASEHQKAAELAEEHGEELIGMGFTEEFNRNIDDLNPNLISKRIWSELLIHKGHILTVNGEWDKAKTLYEDSLKLSEKIDHKCGMARAYNAIGIIHYRKGDWKSAMRNYELALDLANKEDDDKNSSKIYSNIGLINWGNGKFEKAIEFIKRSLELSKKLNEKQGIARAYNNLGIIYWEQHKYDEAIDSYNMSLEISKELGDKQTIAILYDNLGEVYRLKNDKQRAEKFYKKSLEISEVLGFKWQIAEVNCNLGLLYKSLDKNRSKKHLNTALELYTTLGAKRELEKVKELMKLK